jgi:hypothetical protein
MQVLDHLVVLFLIFLRTCTLCSIMANTMLHWQQPTRVPFRYILTNTYCFGFFSVALPVGVG